MVSSKVCIIVCVVSLLSYADVTRVEKKCTTGVTRDTQCAARYIDDRSIICVCNDTYCDTITRDIPPKGRYISYTSSEGGSRFKKKSGIFRSNSSKKSTYTFELDPETRYQTIEGFGTAATGSAGYNLKSLPCAVQENLIKSYFSNKGLEYNMLRVPIGGCDFSLSEFAYNELPIDDRYLTNYTLNCEDNDYKIPIIKRMMEVSKAPLHVIASTWSPPKWMKYYTDDNPTCGYLKKEYFQTYADYHLKFLQQYAAQGVPIWGITTTNEPTIAFSNIPVSSCIGWTSNQMGKWIAENLGPTIRNSTFKNTKILALDDQRYLITDEFYEMIKDHPRVLDYIDGLAVHYYYDRETPVQILQQFHKTYPDLFVISTEASEGFQSFQKKKVDLGSWQRAETYIKDILQDLNNNVVGWIDWNFCLDQNGGPAWTKHYVDSPIIVNAERGEFYKQPMYYAMGHFSKFIPRGSRRIRVKACTSKYMDEVAFLTPENTIVLVIYNDDVNPASVVVKLGERRAKLKLEAKSITTVEFHNDEHNCNSTSLVLHVNANPVVLKLKAGRVTIQIQ